VRSGIIKGTDGRPAAGPLLFHVRVRFGFILEGALPAVLGSKTYQVKSFLPKNGLRAFNVNKRYILKKLFKSKLNLIFNFY